MRFIILIINFLFSNYLVAQETKIKDEAVVSATRFNIVFVGVENPVQIAIPNLSTSAIRVSCDNATLSGSKGNYLLSTSVVGQIKVRVYSLKNNDTIEHGVFPFRSKLVPDPIAYLAGSGWDGVYDYTSIKEFKKIKGIVASLDNFDFDAKFDIISFQVSIIKKDINLVSTLIIGPYLSDQIKDWITKLEVGDRLTVYNIKARGGDNIERELMPISFVFKKE